MREIGKIFRSNVKQYTMIIILVLCAIFFGIVTKGVLLNPQNVANLIQQNAYVIILAVGMMICILTGGNIDLSVGSLVAIVGALCGWLMIGLGWNVWLVLALSFTVAIIAGTWHGFWISRFNIPSFIATLSGMLIFRGLSSTILRGQTYFSYPEDFLSFTTGFLEDVLGGPGAPFNVTTVVIGFVVVAIYIFIEIVKRKQKKKYAICLIPLKLFVLKIIILSAIIITFMYVLALYKGIPIVLIPVSAIVIFYSYILNNTVIGRRVYAIGGNKQAAYLSGINVKKVLLLTYANMAFLSAIAGIVFTARINAASPKAGNGFELDAIAACFIGGASASGGIGTISGALVGALVMGLLNNGMSILGIEPDLQLAVKGFALLMAVVLDVVQKNRAR